MALGKYFLGAIQPFIWRKSLDFGQLKNITSMTAQIRDHFSRGQKLGPGFDVKRGVGGIRIVPDERSNAVVVIGNLVGTAITGR